MLAAIVVAAVGIAWLIRWVTDDAYISFTYARNLARGDGLTWFGEPVEGYTNFGWVLWIAGGIAAGCDPLAWAWAGSLAALAVAIVATYQVVQLRSGSSVAAACAAGLLASNFTFLAFATSGLETMLQAALLAIAWLDTERLARVPPAPWRLVRLSIVCAFAIWTRLDSAAIVVVLAAATGYRLARDRAGARGWLAAVVPATVLIGGWFGWKLAYYGDVLPNTFHAKVGLSAPRILHGAAYAGAFLHAYLLWPVLAAVAAIAIVRRRLRPSLPVALVLAWLAYVVAVGGDFMEFRFFVPMMPALFAIVAEAVAVDPGGPTAAKLPPAWLRAVAIVSVLGALSWRHAARFDGVSDDLSYDSVHMMSTFYGVVPDGAWDRPGRVLRDALATTGATLACNGAGAIPYFAELPTVDQLGLNDRWVARHGVRPPDSYIRPGHQRFATAAYLAERKVNFVIGSPIVIDRGDLTASRDGRLPRHWLVLLLGPAALPVRHLLAVAAPLDDSRALVLWYLTPTPEITQRIRAAGWEIRELAW